jgi:hypothetical protein
VSAAHIVLLCQGVGYALMQQKLLRAADLKATSCERK